MRQLSLIYSLILFLVIPQSAWGQLRLSIYDLDFGHLPLGESDQDIIFIRNGGKEVAKNIYCDIEGSTDFTCEETCTNLNPAGACSLMITFSPTSLGKKTATAMIYSDNFRTLKLKLLGQGYNL